MASTLVKLGDGILVITLLISNAIWPQKLGQAEMVTVVLLVARFPLVTRLFSVCCQFLRFSLVRDDVKEIMERLISRMLVVLETLPTHELGNVFDNPLQDVVHSSLHFVHFHVTNHECQSLSKQRALCSHQGFGCGIRAVLIQLVKSWDSLGKSLCQVQYHVRELFF